MRPSDEDLNEIRMILEKKDARTWEQSFSCLSRLSDGLYVVQTGTKTWCLSIYRNVKEPRNELEIALNYRKLGSAEDMSAAKHWVETTFSNLEHGPSGIHKDNKSTTHRCGMTLVGARQFVTQLQLAKGNRWQTQNAEKVLMPDQPSLTPEKETCSAAELVAVLRSMLHNSRAACEQSGRETVTVGKNKQFRFDSDDDFYAYVLPLLQPMMCAITGLDLDVSMSDPDLAPSLDRKDSSQHYEPGNLQVVARFVNRWKSDDSDENFRRLLKLVSAKS